MLSRQVSTLRAMKLARSQELPADPRRSRRKPRGLGVLAGASRLRDPSTGEERYSLDLLDLDASQPALERIPLDVFGHGLAVHPARPREAVLFEKQGRQGRQLDLVERRVVQPIAPLPGHLFYGHGAYSLDGEALFVVETCAESREGVVSIRDARSFAVLGAFPTYGAAPHDCRLIEGGRTLAITNGGGPIGSSSSPCVTFVDVMSHKLVERHEVSGRDRNAGHLAVGRDREFAVVSAPREGLPAATSLGGVSLRARAQPCFPMTAPGVVVSRLVGEALSVTIHARSRTAVATHPDADLVTFWNLDRGALAGSLELPGPRGVAITLDERFYVVSYGDDARLMLIETEGLRPLADHRLALEALAGAHLYVLAL